MMTLEELNEKGVNVDSALERFMGNEELFRSFLKSLPQEPSYQEMMDAITQNDIEQAFDCAHRLKGILGNLSLVKVYNSICVIVEELRVKKMPSKQQLLDFVELYEECLAYVKEL